MSVGEKKRMTVGSILIDTSLCRALLFFVLLLLLVRLLCFPLSHTLARANYSSVFTHSLSLSLSTIL